jgi:hypothetical protein
VVLDLGSNDQVSRSDSVDQRAGNSGNEDRVFVPGSARTAGVNGACRSERQPLGVERRADDAAHRVLLR